MVDAVEDAMDDGGGMSPDPEADSGADAEAAAGRGRDYDDYYLLSNRTTPFFNVRLFI